MKKFLLILALLTLVLTGCTSVTSTAPADGGSKLTSDSAPAVLLNTPNRARDAAAAANERAGQAQQQLPRTPSGP